MDRMTTVSAALFLAADVFAIVSLAMPDWIVTDVGGINSTPNTRTQIIASKNASKRRSNMSNGAKKLGPIVIVIVFVICVARL